MKKALWLVVLALAIAIGLIYVYDIKGIDISDKKDKVGADVAPADLGTGKTNPGRGSSAE